MPTQIVTSSPARGTPPPAEAQGFLRLQRAGAFDSGGHIGGSSAAPAPCSFVEAPSEASMAELLLAHPELSGYAAVFAAAQIEPGLAVDLSDSQLERLLPGAPLGHILRLKRVFTEAARVKTRLPAGPAWQMAGRSIGGGVRENNLAAKATLVQELNVIAASLLLSCSLPVLLHNLPGECSDGSSCTTLRTVNAGLWVTVTLCFLMATVQAFIIILMLPIVGTEHLPRFIEDRIVSTPPHGHSTCRDRISAATNTAIASSLCRPTSRCRCFYLFLASRCCHRDRSRCIFS